MEINVITRTGNHWVYPIERIEGDYAITINGYHKIPLRVLNTNKSWHGNYYFDNLTDLNNFNFEDTITE